MDDIDASDNDDGGDVNDNDDDADGNSGHIFDEVLNDGTNDDDNDDNDDADVIMIKKNLWQ